MYKAFLSGSLSIPEDIYEAYIERNWKSYCNKKLHEKMSRYASSHFRRGLAQLLMNVYFGNGSLITTALCFNAEEVGVGKLQFDKKMKEFKKNIKKTDRDFVIPLLYQLLHSGGLDDYCPLLYDAYIQLRYAA